ncbi:site-specific integrase [Bacteroides sp. KH569_7]|uniref:Site-specific integrase n=1 Tax=Bacteroides muris (ex Fokt et al. 2023) TaxID=2937417 RepID=A0A9X2NZX1_9BACE|nr:site-specific integrase [Bacteroides muris (ex Fokt et al. 2023)]MCR6509044.1 site-specific integrase [Bacteroides muris (ex Fokt et al. 2023)]
MKKTNFSTRAYVMKNGQVMIRVRWNSKKNEVGFSVGYTIDPLKWDSDKQLVKSNTTHKIGGKIVYAREINNAICSFLVCIEEVFAKYDLHSKIPTTTDLKELVNEKLGRVKQETVDEDKMKTLKDIFSEFLLLRPQEGNWGDKIHEKYDQMWTQLSSCDPNITLETLNQLKVQELVGWYIKNDYCNRTIQKQIRILKSFLRWVSRHGYTINSGVLEFKLRLKVIPRTVTFLKYKELMHFFHYEFPKEKEYLSKARDMFCFMAFTSLRYSDLAALRPVNLVDGYLDFCTEKTDDKLHIALNEHAQRIIDKYSWYKGNTIFPVPSNQKLNDYLKEAAKLAGLDREISQVYFKGNTRHEDTYKFWEQISCHDARRTFVCCSLALGIPASVVMSCTGHSDYATMKPYIEVADETQKIQIEKWNTHQYKSGIIESMEKMTPTQLKQLFEYVKSIA